MSTIALNPKSIDNFFGFLSNMDTNSKKRLIIKLTESIDDNKLSKKNIQPLFGAWIDDRDDEEITSDMRNARSNNSEILDF
jgi:hypothetical protein